MGDGASARHAYGHRRIDRAATGRQRDRQAGTLHRAGDCATGIQLEDRYRPGVERAGARGDGEHDGHALRRGPEHAGAESANRTAPRHDAGRRAGTDDLLRLRHAMHVDHRRGAARDQ